jgi:hypothetical protein
MLLCNGALSLLLEETGWWGFHDCHYERPLLLEECDYWARNDNSI